MFGGVAPSSVMKERSNSNASQVGAFYNTNLDKYLLGAILIYKDYSGIIGTLSNVSTWVR